MPPRQLARSKAMDMRRHKARYVSPLLLPFTDHEAFAHYKKTGETMGTPLDLDARATTAVRKHKKAVRENAAKLERNRAMREYIKVTDMQRMHEKAMRELANRHARR